MPRPRIIPVPFADDTLQVLARDLLAALPGAVAGDLSAALVLLPSSRACRALPHALLAAAGADTLLLPRILTVGQWADEATAALGLPTDPVPDDRTRPLILAPHLAALPWLAENPESAPGLARELLAFCDEARLHRCADRLLDPSRRAEVLALAGIAEAVTVEQDLARIHEAWAIYRDLVPCDATDRLVTLADALRAGPPSPVTPPVLVQVAGFGRIDPVRADLLRAALAAGAEGRLYLPAATGPLARFFAATWGAEPAPTDPLAPARLAERLVLGTEPAPPAPAAATLRERLAELAQDTDPQSLLAPAGPLELVPCADAEAESRLVTDRVARALQDHGGDHRIVVAVNDPRLAARIRAQLADAGIDADATHGDPLSTLPAGLLVRFLLRAALTDLRIEPLLEVLTHPYVQLPVSEGRHGRWTLRLEQMYRQDKGPRGGLAALHRRAEERDQTVLNLIRDYGRGSGAQMVAFVTLIADAFAPLLPFRDGRTCPWADFLAALRASWGLLAPGFPLAAGDNVRPDVARVRDLLDQLERDAAYLPGTDLAGFAADLGRLLGTENAAAHRRPNLPVMVTGLVEARLARCDLLVVAGLRDGIFPGRSRRPLFLGGALRERLGLPGWTAALARDAELFTRLLHAAPRVVLTWSIEDEGAPALPSAFVSRLELVLGTAPETAGEAPPWRRETVPAAAISAAEQVFAAAERDIRAQVPIRPLQQLSWSALRTWRECPYRFLLERAFALRREEEVQEEFRRLDYGNLVHKALEDWLQPGGAGHEALVAGDAPAAQAALDEAAGRHFERGFAEMPQRRLWFETFRTAIPGLVRCELSRFAQWRPVALERSFSLPLDRLRDWVLAASAEAGAGIDPADLPDHADGVVLRGTVDRVDRRQDGGRDLSVIDYKTGVPPSGRSVADLEELQVILYAAAAELGVLDLPGAAGCVEEGVYYAVRTEAPGPPAKPHLPGGTDGRLLLARGGARLIELAVAASDPRGTYPVLPREMAGTAPTRLPCTSCDFRGVCRVEELAVPAATTRKLDKLINRKDQA